MYKQFNVWDYCRPYKYTELQSICQVSTILGTCGLSVITFFHQVLNYYYLTVYIMFKPKIRVRVRVRVRVLMPNKYTRLG